MTSNRIDNKVRKAIYRREGYACALCDTPQRLQIHHVILRSQGGRSTPQNMICLCQQCHSLVHGVYKYPEGYLTQEDAQQAIIEYLADMYAPDWRPWE
ncbi:MAG: HNH endonuclease [Clostridiales bacterium]|nr:HNH endonuclease [Clostridiales bacterium]